jgi:hypothetical protein
LKNAGNPACATFRLHQKFSIFGNVQSWSQLRGATSMLLGMAAI